MTFPFPVFMQSGVAAPNPDIGAYVTSPAAHTNNSSTYSDAGVSIGAADANRITVVVAIWELTITDRAPTNITLDGNNMTLVQSQHSATVGGAAIYYRATPTGTTATIACAGSSDTGVFLAMQFHVYRVIPTSASPLDFGGISAATSPTRVADIEVKNGGFLICAAMRTDTTVPTPSYTGTDTPATDFSGVMESAKGTISWSVNTKEDSTTNDVGVVTTANVNVAAASWF